MTTFEGIKSFYDYRQVTVEKLNEDTDSLIKARKGRRRRIDKASVFIIAIFRSASQCMTV